MSDTLQVIILVLLIAFLVWTIFRVNSYNPKRWYYYWRSLFYYWTEPKRLIPILISLLTIYFMFAYTDKLPEPIKENVEKIKIKVATLSSQNPEQEACYDSVKLILNRYKTYLESLSDRNILGIQISYVGYNYDLYVVDNKQAAILNRDYLLNPNIYQEARFFDKNKTTKFKAVVFATSETEYYNEYGTKYYDKRRSYYFISCDKSDIESFRKYIQAKIREKKFIFG